MTAKRTPLYHAFLARNAQMAEKAHFLTANVFTDAATEHHAVRNAAGLFEIFGQFLLEVAGDEAEAVLNETFVADMTRLAPGRGVYCGILNDQGGFIDDVITYRAAPDLFWVVPAPHRVARVEAYLRERGRGRRVHAVSLGYRYVSLSLQGPQARACLARVTDADVSNEALPNFGMIFSIKLSRKLFIFSRLATGYFRKMMFYKKMLFSASKKNKRKLKTAILLVHYVFPCPPMIEI